MSVTPDQLKGEGPSERSWDWFDFGVLALIVAFGAVQVLLYQRVRDFQFDDVSYFETARSLLHGFYGFNGSPETNQPPGLAAILALLCLVRASSHASFLRAMAVFETLGIAASYALLRRQLPRAIAASICLILISSPLYFALATQSVANSFPLLLTTVCALLLADRLEKSLAPSTRLVYTILLAMLVSASLMIASASMALLGAIVMIIGVGLVRDRHLALTRLKTYGAVLLIGVAVQGLWMHRKPAPLEWPIPGYPRPYLEQLKVKDGNDPELGLATPVDIPVRVGRNLFDQSVLLTQVLYPQWINEDWSSVLILGPLLLILLGWGLRVWDTGGSLQDWYFALYQVIYLLWPWKINIRFFLPVAPLACLYVWHGVKNLGPLIKSRPRLSGFVWFPFGVFLALGAWLWERGAWLGRNTIIHGGLQDDLSLVVWVASAIVAARMAWTDQTVHVPVEIGSRWLARPVRALQVRPQRWAQLGGFVVVLGLVSVGFAKELEIGRDNLSYGLGAKEAPADDQAGLWIRSNTAPDAIVMAVQVPTVYYYADRKTVWFPPSTDARMLMEGIGRHHVQYVIVAKRLSPFYLPDDEDCFASLYKAYPSAFRLVVNAPQFRIFQVVSEQTENTSTVKTFSQ